MAQRDEGDRLVPDPSSGSANPGKLGKPPITADMRANARANPNSWLYVIDEAFDPAGPVPPAGIVGAYPVDASGEIVDDFHPNAAYRPSPQALGFPEPASELERLLHLVRTEHRSAADLPKVILDATVWVYALSPLQRTVTGFHNVDGRVLVPAYTSKSLAPREWPHARGVLGRDIVGLLGGHPLALNPHKVVTAVVPAEQLQTALDAEM